MENLAREFERKSKEIDDLTGDLKKIAREIEELEKENKK